MRFFSKYVAFLQMRRIFSEVPLFFHVLHLTKCATLFFNCAAFFQMGKILFFQMRRIILNTSHFSKCAALFPIFANAPQFFQIYRIFPDMLIFHKCTAFFQMRHIFSFTRTDPYDKCVILQIDRSRFELVRSPFTLQQRVKKEDLNGYRYIKC